MKKRILVAGFAMLSLFAAAQSQSKGTNDAPAPASEVKAPRDHATGQASGQKNIVHRDLAARDAATGHASGKVTPHDDWQTKNAVSTGSTATVKPVAAADVDGDGQTDKTEAEQSNAHVQSPRDVATGQASGKRQHKPISVQKEVEAPKKQ